MSCATPNRVVLAVAAPDLLERPRMLPVVGHAKQVGVGDVLERAAIPEASTLDVATPLPQYRAK
jgi:hypothetical protein